MLWSHYRKNIAYTWTANFIYNGIKNCLGSDWYTSRKRFHGHNSLINFLTLLWSIRNGPSVSKMRSSHGQSHASFPLNAWVFSVILLLHLHISNKSFIHSSLTSPLFFSFCSFLYCFKFGNNVFKFCLYFDRANNKKACCFSYFDYVIDCIIF